VKRAVLSEGEVLCFTKYTPLDPPPLEF
jgi:hypothetical protein